MHYDIRVQGKVQGVFYRSSTEKKARELNLTGFVRNDPDGTVYLEAEGPMPAVVELIDWCHRGPKDARVMKVNYAPGAMRNFQKFETKG